MEYPDDLVTPPPYQATAPPSYIEAEDSDNVGHKPNGKSSPAGAVTDFVSAGPVNAGPVNAGPVNAEDPADPDVILPPVVLVLDRMAIYAESDPDAPLYQVNRGLASLGPPTKSVEFERVERRVSPQTGRLKLRPRHIYNLRVGAGRAHIVSTPLMLKMPSYYMETVVNARWAPVGSLGLKASRVPFHKEWTALPVRIDPSKDTVFDTARTTTAPLFKARSHGGVCTWTDAQGQEVARQHETAADATTTTTTTPRLIITAPLRRDMRDALVALWCLYVWEQAVMRHVEVPLPRPKHERVGGWMLRSW